MEGIQNELEFFHKKKKKKVQGTKVIFKNNLLDVCDNTGYTTFIFQGQ